MIKELIDNRLPMKNKDSYIVKGDSIRTVTKDNEVVLTEPWYMKNAVKIPLSMWTTITGLHSYGSKVMYYILSKIYNNNRFLLTTTDRKEMGNKLHLSSSDITKGLKELTDKSVGLLVEKEDGYYEIPMDKLVRGNVDKMVRKLEEEKREKEEEAKELYNI